MNKRRIVWEKFRNPILPARDVGNDEQERMMIRVTPFGPECMQINPDFSHERVYIGHTNFDIDEEVKNIIENTEGVEILEVYSPYRIRVTVGKAFHPKKVRRSISNILCTENKRYNFDKDTNLCIYEETLRLKSQEKPWSMFILPNGKYESHTYQTENEMQKYIQNLDIVQRKIGGVILTS